MFYSLISDPFTLIHFSMRYLHVFFAVIWIGLLYYFNFVQGSFMAETDAAAKSQVFQKLVPRALWWFRYGALGTFLTGLVMLSARAHLDMKAQGAAAFASSYWINILTGGLMATLMFLKVWLIIWPKQKILIGNAVKTATGGTADPHAPAAAAKAGLASRTNVLFSIPMIFFMVGASHLGYPVSETSQVCWYFIVLFILIGTIQANGMFGKTGPIATIKGVITAGFILTGVLIGLITVLV